MTEKIVWTRHLTHAWAFFLLMGGPLMAIRFLGHLTAVVVASVACMIGLIVLSERSYIAHRRVITTSANAQDTRWLGLAVIIAGVIVSLGLLAWAMYS